VVLSPPELNAAAAELIQPLLDAGVVIVRSAHPDEDGDDTSWAGMGRSIAGCTDIDQVGAAVTEICAYVKQIWLENYGAGQAPLQILVQREIRRAWLLVTVWTPEGGWYTEAHDEPGEVLSTGATPRYAGPLATWDHPSLRAVQRLGDKVREKLRSRHGLDLEIVVDEDGDAWLVQARPLTTPLHPGWGAFEAAIKQQVEAAENPIDLDGLLTLDGEHNPAPLSPAHEWLMGWLRQQRPAAGDPAVLAGWLYVRVLPRDLAGAPKSIDVREVLARLQSEHLPRARATLAALDERLSTCDATKLRAALKDALALFLDMIDIYLGELVPARRGAAKVARETSTQDPLSLRGREEFLDVLPAAWDVASPTLRELIPRGRAPTSEPTALPDDPGAAATLLAEWDDHLFALGLAPLRAFYGRAALLAALDPQHAFLLEPQELCEAVEHDDLSPFTDLLRSRGRAMKARGRLKPPLRLWDGRPLPAACGSRLRGVPVGESFIGRIAQRAGLPELLADPPAADAIVCIPSLTAQAAVAVDRLGMRAVCTEYGGALSHGTLMARELGLSALIGCRDSTTIEAGRRARIDTRAGRLIVLED
jgi:phosphohistidine swiveling domain-containing protein